MQIIYPPRPVGKIPASELPRMEKSGKWVAQRKFNGDHCVIYRDETGKIQLFSRYGRSFKNYHLPKYIVDEFDRLQWKAGKTYWLDGELMRNLDGKQDYLILFDILQAGDYLYGVDLMTRIKMLASLCCSKKSANLTLANPVTDHIWLAETWENDFVNHFAEHTQFNGAVEGLVLKKKKSSLDNFGAREYEVPWLVRVRIEGKTYIY